MSNITNVLPFDACKLGESTQGSIYQANKQIFCLNNSSARVVYNTGVLFWRIWANKSFNMANVEMLFMETTGSSNVRHIYKVYLKLFA